MNEIGYVNFWFWPLDLWPHIVPTKNSPNNSKGGHIFPITGRGDRALIVTYFDTPMADIFPH